MIYVVLRSPKFGPGAVPTIEGIYGSYEEAKDLANLLEGDPDADIKISKMDNRLARGDIWDSLSSAEDVSSR